MPERLPRRLIEVDLPIKRISEQARREKSIRHGHISTLHIWWARRPLAACRAVILAGLLPDPADEACPQSFRNAAVGALAWRRTPADDREGLRQALLDFIAEFSNWDLAAHPDYLRTARALVTAAYPEGPPTVLDPFAGGGAIPLEALRVGAEAWASDLNPVAVLLEKVVLEYVPRYGQRLAEGVRRWGEVIRERARSELGRFYPEDPDGSVPIAYLWVRTARCEGPACGARVPLLRGRWLSRRPDHQVALELLVHDGEVEFAIREGVRAQEVGPGTVRRGSLTCPICGHTTPVAAIRRQAQRQGLPERLVAVVTTRPGMQGRRYRLPLEHDLRAAEEAEAELERRAAAHRGPLSLVPDEPLPPKGTLGFRIQGYGLETWGDLFTPRQKLALSTLARLVHDVHPEIVAETGDEGLARAITTSLGLVTGRCVDYWNSLCRWVAKGEFTAGGNGGQNHLSMTWDFSEASPFSNASGDYEGALDWVVRVLMTNEVVLKKPGVVNLASATLLSNPDESVEMLVTDPPYYDAFPYADLSISSMSGYVDRLLIAI